MTTCYTSLCYSCRRNTYSLNKGLLIKYWWLVICRWCLTSASWTPSTSSSSTSHLTVQMAVKYNAVFLRHKHSPKTLFIHRNQCIYQILVRQPFHSKPFFCQQKFYFQKFHFFQNFVSFYLILFYLIKKIHTLISSYWKIQKHIYLYFFFHFPEH